VYDRAARTQGATEITDETYELTSVGDLMEHLIDGWQIDRLHYADSCAPVGPPDAPGAFFELSRTDEGRKFLFVPDDGRTFSHRALIALFRDRPHIWKHLSPDRFPETEAPAGPPQMPEEWGEMPNGYPEAVAFEPATLLNVVAVNQSQAADDVTIAVTALELYEDAARVRYLAHAAGADARNDLMVMDAVAIDDSGRLYRVEQHSCDRRGNRLDGGLVIAPAPPREVAGLTVTIGTVGGGLSGTEPARGPWVFPISLRAAP